MVLAGDLDAEGAARLMDYLRRRGPDSNVILDLWDVTECDSAGVAAIQEAKEHIERPGWGFAVVADPKGLCAVALDATGRIPVFATRSAARGALVHSPS